jgi:hypothetical protein
MSVYRPAERLKLDMPEIVSARTLVSKTYDAGNGKKRLRQSMGPVHYLEDDNSWQEVDLTPVDMGDHWRIEKAFYRLTIWKDVPGIEYESRAGGSATVTIDTIGGNRPATVAPVLDGLACRWADCAPDFDLEMIFRPAGIEWVRALKSERAPREWAFLVEERGKPVDQSARGKDASGRALDLAGTTGEVGGKRVVAESFEGRVSAVVDPKTRKRAWIDAVEYPVRITDA